MFANLHPAIPQEAKTTKEENNMTEFHTERTALERDLYKAYHAAQAHLRTKHALDDHRPETVREYIEMVKEGKYEDIPEKTLDRKLNEWEEPAGYVHLRHRPADHDAHKAEAAKLDEDYRVAELERKVHDPKDAMKKTEAFRKTWVH